MNKNKDFYIIDTYLTKEIKLSNSIFISHLEYADNFEDIKYFISNTSELYKDATHNCWAYITGINGNNMHSSDDGEPAGTAGKPILNTLQKYNLTNVVAIVTRYYGGTKLGVRGLIDAYSKITEDAILSTQLKKLVEKQTYKITIAYDFFDILKHKIKDFNSELLNVEYSDKIKINISVEKKFSLEFEYFIKSNNYIFE
ncbi:MAG: YigZ family protein [Cyanobacteriota bacterium]